MNERAITDAIIRHLKRLRDAGEQVWWFKVAGGPMQTSGIPDLCVVFRGRAVFLEVKLPRGRTTVLQERRMEEIRRAGGTAVVARSVADVVKAMLREAQASRALDGETQCVESEDDAE